MKLRNWRMAAMVAALMTFVTLPAAQAGLLDVSAFTAEAGVTLAGGEVNFTESESPYADFYLYDPDFFVDPAAISLTFDYSLAIGPDNDDYLVVQIGEYPYEFEVGPFVSIDTPVTLTGSAGIDLTPYQNSSIYLAFGFEANDDLTDSIGGFSNIQVNTAVPLPPAILLMGCGLLGIVGARKKQRK